MEKGLPRGVGDGGGGGDNNSISGNPNVQNNNYCCDNSGLAAGTVVDRVHSKQQRLDGGGGDSKSTGGGVGGNRGRRALRAAVKLIAITAAFTVTFAFVWYTMGLPFLLQVVVIATIAFIASGGYKFVYLVYRTAPRDLK